MESWNVQQIGDREFLLLNKTQTLITLAKQVQTVHLASVLSRLEELKVPLSYSEGISEIRFTRLRGVDEGWYQDSQIMLHAYTRSSVDQLVRTLVHELGHHVDSHEGMSEQDWVLKEKKERADHLFNNYAKKNVCEYIASGFEVFYCGTKDERERMKKMNPFLFGIIRMVHKKYRSL
jgi:hypothetical protein